MQARAFVPGIDQRIEHAFRCEGDLMAAERLGRACIDRVAAGERAVLLRPVRGASPAAGDVRFSSTPLSERASLSRSLAPAFVERGGFDVTDAYAGYVRGLVGPIAAPRFAQRPRVRVTRRLPAFDPGAASVVTRGPAASRPYRHASEPGVLLLAYRRPDHTRRVLDALRREGVRQVLVNVDAAADAKSEAERAKVLEVLAGVEDLQLDLHLASENRGLAHAVVGAVGRAFERHERVIVLEDDCCPRPGYFGFVRAALERYADEPAVRSVCGYQYPGVCRPGRRGVEAPARAHLLPRFNPWGWATWRDRWIDYSSDLRELVARSRAEGAFETLDADLQAYCEGEAFLSGDADVWSLNWILVHALTRSGALFPSRSLIDNIGFDGTGVHSQETAVFDWADPRDDARAGPVEVARDARVRPRPRSARRALPGRALAQGDASQRGPRRGPPGARTGRRRRTRARAARERVTPVSVADATVAADAGRASAGPRAEERLSGGGLEAAVPGRRRAHAGGGPAHPPAPARSPGLSRRDRSTPHLSLPDERAAGAGAARSRGVPRGAASRAGGSGLARALRRGEPALGSGTRRGDDAARLRARAVAARARDGRALAHASRAA